MANPRTLIADRDSYPVRDSVRQEHNKAVADVFYIHRNRAGTIAPVAARATNNTGVKTTTTTAYIAGGAPKSLAAADPVWALTGGVLAISSFRKYRLLHDGTTATVQASSDAATAAACVFSNPVQPIDGVAILAQLTVATDGVTTFTPATTSLAAAGITATFTDGSDGSEITASQVTP